MRSRRRTGIMVDMLAMYTFGASTGVVVYPSGIAQSTDPTTSAQLVELQNAINVAASALKMGDVISKLDGKIGQETVLAAVAVAKAAMASLDPSRIMATKTFGALATADASQVPTQLRTWTSAIANDRVALTKTFGEIAVLAAATGATAPATAAAVVAAPSRRGLYIGLAALGLAVIGAGIFIATRTRPDRRPAPRRALRRAYA